IPHAPLPQTTLLGTLLHHDKRPLRSPLPELTGILLKTPPNNPIAQAQGLRYNRPSPGILRREPCDGDGRLAVRVNLRVEGPHGEHRHLPWTKLGADDALVPVCVEDAGLGDGLGEEAA